MCLGWINLRLINHSFWDHASLTQRDDFQRHPSSAWALGFPQVHTHPLPDRCSREACRVSYSKSRPSHVGISSEQWAHFTDVGKTRDLPSHDKRQGVQMALGKHLRGLLLPFSQQANSICCPLTQGTLKKAFAKSNPALCPPGTIAKISKMAATSDIAPWERHHLVHSQRPAVSLHGSSGFFLPAIPGC